MVDPYYVHVTEAKTVRVHLLKSVKLSLDASLTYYKLDGFHKERSALVETLQGQIETLMNDFVKLQEILPYKELLAQSEKKEKAKLAASKRTVAPKKKVVVKKATVKKAIPQKDVISKVDSPMDNLNAALADIEKRLNDIS